jgi:hypothetical protein
VKSILALGTALLMAACSAHVAATTRPSPPTLSRDEAEQLILRADDLRRQAFEFPGTALPNAFAGSALKMLEEQSQNLGRRGLREDERNVSRELVSWVSISAEGVLQVAAERRLVSPDQLSPPWSATVRQWWVRLQFVKDNWKVVDQQDLPPDQWRSVMT